MARRHNHYEAAFEALLRDVRTPYVAVDETRRSLVQEASGRESLKSVDFLVSPTGSRSLLIDIKGRRFPSGVRNKQYWRNWSTRDDLRSLAEWARYFGEGFTPLLMFAFEVTGDRSPVGPTDLFRHRGRAYGFVGVELAEYWQSGRTLSAKWDTIAMPAANFRRHARPWRHWLSHSQPSGADHLCCREA